MSANGVVFYEGPSTLNGEPIVGIVTGLSTPSLNSKTGDMAQAWILRSDMDPSEAIKSGNDDAICGDCSHRSADGNIGRSCYVVWWLGPMNVYKAYRRHDYPFATSAGLETAMLGHYVRLGAYGDPAAIPYREWLPILRGASGAIGYTQQWRTCDQMFSRCIMASVQSAGEAKDAQAMGWRTFRTRAVGGDIFDNEVICPASHESDHQATCRDCQLCQGSVRHAKSVVIQAHGQRMKWFSEASSR